MDHAASDLRSAFVFLMIVSQPEMRLVAQVKEDTTVWELFMMLEAINTEMVKGRKLRRTPDFHLLYKGNKIAEYHKTVKDYGINYSTATSDNPAVLYMTFNQRDAA